MTGFECFSDFTGYGGGFKFAGNHVDSTEIEETEYGPRRLSYMVAMDAIHFSNPNSQYSKEMIDRELNKAYVAFRADAE